MVVVPEPSIGRQNLLTKKSFGNNMNSGEHGGENINSREYRSDSEDEDNDQRRASRTPKKHFYSSPNIIRLLAFWIYHFIDFTSNIGVTIICFCWAYRHWDQKGAEFWVFPGFCACLAFLATGSFSSYLAFQDKYLARFGKCSRLLLCVFPFGLLQGMIYKLAWHRYIRRKHVTGDFAASSEGSPYEITNSSVPGFRFHTKAFVGLYEGTFFAGLSAFMITHDVGPNNGWAIPFSRTEVLIIYLALVSSLLTLAHVAIEIDYRVSAYVKERTDHSVVFSGCCIVGRVAEVCTTVITLGFLIRTMAMHLGSNPLWSTVFMVCYWLYGVLMLWVVSPHEKSVSVHFLSGFMILSSNLSRFVDHPGFSRVARLVSCRMQILRFVTMAFMVLSGVIQSKGNAYSFIVIMWRKHPILLCFYCAALLFHLIYSQMQEYFVSPERDDIFLLAAEGDVARLKYVLMELQSLEDVNHRRENGQAPIHLAAKYNIADVSAIKVLLVYGKANINLPTSKGKTAMHIAAESGNLLAVKLLADCGAMLNPQDADGNTPLHLAAGKHHNSIVKYLAEHARARIDIPNFDGRMWYNVGGCDYTGENSTPFTLGCDFNDEKERSSDLRSTDLRSDLTLSTKKRKLLGSVPEDCVEMADDSVCVDIPAIPGIQSGPAVHGMPSVNSSGNSSGMPAGLPFPTLRRQETEPVTLRKKRRRNQSCGNGDGLQADSDSDADSQTSFLATADRTTGERAERDRTTGDRIADADASEPTSQQAHSFSDTRRHWSENNLILRDHVISGAEMCHNMSNGERLCSGEEPFAKMTKSNGEPSSAENAALCSTSFDGTQFPLRSCSENVREQAVRHDLREQVLRERATLGTVGDRLGTDPNQKTPFMSSTWQRAMTSTQDEEPGRSIAMQLVRVEPADSVPHAFFRADHADDAETADTERPCDADSFVEFHVLRPCGLSSLIFSTATPYFFGRFFLRTVEEERKFLDPEYSSKVKSFQQETEKLVKQLKTANSYTVSSGSNNSSLLKRNSNINGIQNCSRSTRDYGPSRDYATTAASRDYGTTAATEETPCNMITRKSSGKSSGKDPLLSDPQHENFLVASDEKCRSDRKRIQNKDRRSSNERDSGSIGIGPRVDSAPLIGNCKKTNSSSNLVETFTPTALVPSVNNPRHAPKRRDPLQHIDWQKLGPKDFVVQSQLGHGTFGTVMKVQLRDDPECQLAMKLLDKTQYKVQQIVSRYYAEEHVLRTLKHPFIVLLYATFSTPTHWMLLMELCPGGDLHDLLTTDGTPGLSRLPVLKAAAEILLALEFLHSRGIIFRDLKCENVILSANKTCRLTDFGLAKEDLDVGKAEGVYSFCGSYGYCAPEVLAMKGKHKRPKNLYDSTKHQRDEKQDVGGFRGGGENINHGPDRQGQMVQHQDQMKNQETPKKDLTKFVAEASEDKNAGTANNAGAGGGYGTSVDIYSFGILLYMLVQGGHVAQRKNRRTGKISENRYPPVTHAEFRAELDCPRHLDTYTPKALCKVNNFRLPTDRKQYLELKEKSVRWKKHPQLLELVRGMTVTPKDERLTCELMKTHPYFEMVDFTKTLTNSSRHFKEIKRQLNG